MPVEPVLEDDEKKGSRTTFSDRLLLCWLRLFLIDLLALCSCGIQQQLGSTRASERSDFARDPHVNILPSRLWRRAEIGMLQNQRGQTAPGLNAPLPFPLANLSLPTLSTFIQGYLHCSPGVLHVRVLPNVRCGLPCHFHRTFSRRRYCRRILHHPLSSVLAALGLAALVWLVGLVPWIVIYDIWTTYYEVIQEAADYKLHVERHQKQDLRPGG